MVDQPSDLLVRVSAVSSRSVTAPAAAPHVRARRTATREAIVEAATTLFLRQGYQGTSTDQIAAAAGVSKQTLYNQFGDKGTLLREIVLGVTATAQRFVDSLPDAFAGITAAGDVGRALRELGERYLSVTLNPDVVALRRLLIGEAGRFPDLAASYHAGAPATVLSALATQLADLDRRELLKIDDPVGAAEDLAFLLLGAPLDHALFHPRHAPPGGKDIRRRVARAIRVFLAAHGGVGLDEVATR